MLMFVAVVANVGQAVNRRIALQIVADAGAYTGASIMGTGSQSTGTLEYNACSHVGAVRESYISAGWPFLCGQTLFSAPRLLQDIGGYIELLGRHSVRSSTSSIRPRISATRSSRRRKPGTQAISMLPTCSPASGSSISESDSPSTCVDDPLGVIPPARSAFQLDESPLVDDGTPTEGRARIRHTSSSLCYHPAERRLNYSCYQLIWGPIRIPFSGSRRTSSRGTDTPMA